MSASEARNQQARRRATVTSILDRVHLVDRSPSFKVATLAGLMRNVAKEGASRGIRASAICPGLVDMPLGRHTSAGRPSRGASGVPFGRMASSWEIAYAALFVSDESVYVNAQTLAVDSGITGL